LPLVWAALAGAFFGGIVVLYVFGIWGMALMLEKSFLEAAPLALPFLVGDLIKVGLAAFLTRWVALLRPMALLSRR
jgi:biotin transport system substrate-specific component